ncbi:cyclic nucleotide-binding domain-containing protein [Lichenifustis flavocetrariae]|uniref:Cyclic nucleotide-binding domain-containing protein n=1 Tax=Lichenifustis flavocetrariae TaxID=2949735 RepID=A0AA41Z502_9HYPH|nr:cyclic nucleotide-binding domain-containing protein [Lichenifustis flavocetrariae]MCW6510583.1 cyclic nucleotide-binding domain-containing protein [Lichenifustis flavocetrariae]
MNAFKEDVEVLRGVPIFASVDAAKLKLLAFASQRLVFDEGQTLCKEGERGEQAYVIVKGEADVFVRAGEYDIRVASVGRNDFVGDIAILCDTPRTATVRATSRCETLAIGKAQLMGLLRSFPEMSIAIMRVLASRLERTNHALAEAQRLAKAH